MVPPPFLALFLQIGQKMYERCFRSKVYHLASNRYFDIFYSLRFAKQLQYRRFSQQRKQPTKMLEHNIQVNSRKQRRRDDSQYQNEVQIPRPVDRQYRMQSTI